MLLPIIIDDRERASGLAEAVRRAVGVAPEVRRLAVGDVWVGERLIIERKEAGDFVASILDGRLASQLDALIRLPGTAAIILEGEFTPAVLAGLSPHDLRRQILQIQFVRRIAVIRSRDLTETAQWIAALAASDLNSGRAAGLDYAPPPTHAAPRPAGHRARRSAPPLSAPASPAMITLRQIPGVGADRARLLLDRFGTIEALRAAPDSALAELDGIGPAVIAAIRRAFPPRRQSNQ